jgi:bifunctional non-homologous end joining protein LigD
MANRGKHASNQVAGRRGSLAKYRAKRDFSTTPEPSGGPRQRESRKKSAALAFVIQKHAASRLHYDFRLEWDGVLKSWAVAKGPSYYPGDKRLAVQVEDHPLEYGGFEGIIPKGQYGGGTVMLWDRGTWEPHGDAAQGLRDGNLKFTLHGEKLHGNWVLVRMGGRMANASKPNWLLIKEHDSDERGANETPVTEEEPTSVLSGRNMEAIAAAKDAVWNSKSGASANAASPKPERRAVRIQAARHPSKRHEASVPASRMKAARKESLPSFIPPQLATLVRSSPTGGGWVHELKLDGYRIEARIETRPRPSAQLLTRTAQDWTHRMPAIAEAVAALPVRSALLDGEVVALDSNGMTSFANLQAAFQESARYPLTYFVFDLLHLDGRNLRDLPLIGRKEILSDLLSAVPGDGPVRISEHLAGDGQTVFGKACKLGAEGILSKLANSKYVSGRGNSWLKLKCYREQEFVIGGFTLPSNGTHGVGALLLGYYENGKLIYAGRSGTGFTQKTHRLIRNRLEALRRETTAFAHLPAAVSRGARWVKPELVAQISFANWTGGGLVRQAAFKGLREDKPAKSVHREEEDPVSTEADGATERREPARRKHGKKDAADGVNTASAPSSAPLPVRLTHPGKVLDAVSELTKDGLAHYYAAIAPHMLPHIAGRPLSLVRCLNGSSKPCFFQKHANESLPREIESVDIVDKKTGKPEPYITLSTSGALLELAQLSVLEIHAWGSRNGSIEKPDRVIIDLDPDAAIDWKTLASAAGEVRERLKAAGLESFLKITGGKGLHVVAPVRPEHEWPAVKEFAHNLVLAMETDHPSLYLTRMTKAARKGKIYLDYLRNERGATSIAPYSPRAREGATVAMPLEWTELKSKQRPIFPVSGFTAWKARLGDDPWKGMERIAQRLNV